MMQTPWHKKKDFLKLKREWDKTLKADGFDDIEGGTEGHLIKTHGARVQLKCALGPRSQSRDDFELEDLLSSDLKCFHYSESRKARFYQEAGRMAAQIVRENGNQELAYIAIMFSKGVPFRAIGDALNRSRDYVMRKFKPLRANLLWRLDQQLSFDYTDEV